jgi:phosphohistidine phosphatase SixA
MVFQRSRRLTDSDVTTMALIYTGLLLAILLTVASTMAQTKTVYLIRHAESEENRRVLALKAALTALTKFSLPKGKDVLAACELINVSEQIDSHVSAFGTEQIKYMSNVLEETEFLKHHSIDLIAHSPLIRAKQTAMGMLSIVEENQNERPRVEQLDLLIEKTPTEWLPGNSAALQKRLVGLEDWVSAQPESVIVLVGHSQFFKNLLDLEYKFNNCDVMQIQFSAEAPEKKWSSLKTIHSCDLPRPTDDDVETPPAAADVTPEKESS